MPSTQGTSVAPGGQRQSDLEHPAYWWRAPANSLAGPTTCVIGSGVVVDGFQTGGATLFGDAGATTKTTRTVVGSTPNYIQDLGEESVYANVIFPDTVAHARDGFAIYTGKNITQNKVAALSAGDKGWFRWEGITQCLVSVTTTLNEPLTLEESVANSRAGTLRAAVAGEQIHALARQVVVGTATAPVLCVVEIVPARGPTLNA